jgi:ribose transport system substrate-binding protein
VIGYDAGKQQKDAVRSGVEAGAVSQDPVGIGYKCVEAAVKAIRGEKVPKNIDTGFKWYDKTNIAPEMQYCSTIEFRVCNASRVRCI